MFIRLVGFVTGLCLVLLVSACGTSTTATAVPTARLAPTATTRPIVPPGSTAITPPSVALGSTETTPATVAPATTPTAVSTPEPPTAVPTQTPPGLAVSSVTIVPSKDSTLFEQSEGSLANGAGQHIFVGKTNRGAVRRGVIAFDVSGNIPQGSTINRVSLTMNVSRTVAATQDIQLHRLLADWGEGPSDATVNEGSGIAAEAGDVTWVHTRFDSANWQSPGGDFSADPSAVQQVGGLGQYTWGSTDQVVADVQSWLDNPSSNFGWLLLGNESANRTTKRFDSKEHGTEENHPALTIEYDSP